MRFTLKFLVKYFVQLQIAMHELPALFGFCTFLIIINQLYTGTMLAISYGSESLYTPLSREEEDSENLYADDFFFLHERGVDLLVIFVFLHLFRKLYVKAFNVEQEIAWKGGVILYLGLQFVIFTGLLLCCTHLSEITLVIGVNAFNSFCLFIGKISWLIFPDAGLNIDTIIRVAYLHYISAFILAAGGVYHGVDMHYDWKTESLFDGVKNELDWYDEAIFNEVGELINLLTIIGLLCLFLYAEPEALNYEIFMWGDIGMQVDVRFLGVAPHWYFRPYMGWLVACPFHYTGLIGLVLFFTSFYFQPNIIGVNEQQEYNSEKNFFFEVIATINDAIISILESSKYYINHQLDKFFKFTIFRKEDAVMCVPYFNGTQAQESFFYDITYAIFLICIWYAFSYLPFGRFFHRLGGNFSSMLAYIYIYVYLSTTFLRMPRQYVLYKDLYL